LAADCGTDRISGIKGDVDSLDADETGATCDEYEAAGHYDV
jgi:hypothetical protein